MKSIRKIKNVFLFSLILFCSGVVMASAADQGVIVNNPSTNAVYVRTGNSSLSITNNTWDQRLNYIQSATQGTKTNLDTLLNRFGFTGTFYTLSDALGSMYTEQQASNSYLSSVISNGAISVFNSDVFSLLNREFPSGWTEDTSTTKGVLRRIMGFYNDTYPSNLRDLKSILSTTSAITSHIDSDLHSLGSTLSSINSDVDSIQALSNSNFPAIKVNTDNISVDTQSISSNISTWFPFYSNTLNNIYGNTSYLPDMSSDLYTLKEFFADADTRAQKAAAKPASDTAVNAFTGTGSGAASVQDYSDINIFSDDLKSSFTSNIPTQNMTVILSDGSRANWGWFTQATYDSINPQSNTRKSISDVYSVESYMALYEQLEKEGVPDPLQDFYKSLGEAANE